MAQISTRVLFVVSWYPNFVGGFSGNHPEIRFLEGTPSCLGGLLREANQNKGGPVSTTFGSPGPTEPGSVQAKARLADLPDLGVGLRQRKETVWGKQICESVLRLSWVQ